jgi:hypothetical protein
LSGGAGVVLNPQRARSELQTLLPIFAHLPEMSDLLGQKARARVVEKYSLKGNIDHLETFYAQLFQMPKAALVL